jgi:hypothetical protein
MNKHVAVVMEAVAMEATPPSPREPGQGAAEEEHDPDERSTQNLFHGTFSFPAADPSMLGGNHWTIPGLYLKTAQPDKWFPGKRESRSDVMRFGTKERNREVVRPGVKHLSGRENSPREQDLTPHKHSESSSSHWSKSSQPEPCAQRGRQSSNRALCEPAAVRVMMRTLEKRCSECLPLSGVPSSNPFIHHHKSIWQYLAEGCA